MKSLFIKSAKEKQPIELIYIDDKGVISQRVVRVLSLNETYVKAYCYERKQLRTFKCDSILSVDLVRKKVAS